MYALLRAIAGIALRWYYRDIRVEGLERVPRERPLLLVVNHPNALVDALLVGWVVPRRVLITAKSTIFRNPVAASLLHWLGVVPLRRASDEAARPSGGSIDPSRNLETFRAVQDALARGGTVLIFPEGKTPEEPALAPLKTGAARMALSARESGRVPGLAILPIGLVFEQKEAPRSRVLVQIGEPILMEEWKRNDGRAAADALTDEIARRLRALTLSYATTDDAVRAVRLASLLATVLNDTPRVDQVRSLAVDTAIARRIGELTTDLEGADDSTRATADELTRRLDAIQHEAQAKGVFLSDARIETGCMRAARFILRELWFLAIAGPMALWGRINHWLPFRAARAIAMRDVESTADPAMRTIIAGAAFVLLAYLAQTAVVGFMWNWFAAAAYLVSLPIAADVNFYFSERLHRVGRRARAWIRFRREPELQARMCAELDALREAVVRFERGLVDPIGRGREYRPA